MSGARVLVTGGSGFVGRHLCERLIDLGRAVRATGRASARPAALPAAVEWQTLEVGPSTDWSAPLEGVSHVVHLAAHAHHTGRAQREDEATFMRVNAEGTRRLAQAAREATAVRRVVLVSSVAAVSSFATTPIDETTPCRPDSAYGRSKLAAERALVDVLGADGGAHPDWCVLRPPLVYGPGNPGNMARLLALVRTGAPLPLDGIRNRRSFLYVGSLVAAIVACLEHPAASRRVFVVADEEALSTPELVRRIGAAAGLPVRLFPLPVALLRAAGAAGDALGRLLGRELPVGRYAVERLAGSLVVDASLLGRAVGWRAAPLDHALAATFARA